MALKRFGISHFNALLSKLKPGWTGFMRFIRMHLQILAILVQVLLYLCSILRRWSSPLKPSSSRKADDSCKI